MIQAATVRYSLTIMTKTSTTVYTCWPDSDPDALAVIRVARDHSREHGSRCVIWDMVAGEVFAEWRYGSLYQATSYARSLIRHLGLTWYEPAGRLR